MKSVAVFCGVMAGATASGKPFFGAKDTKYVSIGKIDLPVRSVDDTPTYFHLLFTEGKYSGMMTSTKIFKPVGKLQSLDLDSPVKCAECQSTGMRFYDCPNVEYDKTKYTGVAIVSSGTGAHVEKVGKEWPLANGFLMFEKSSCKVTTKGEIGIKVKTTGAKKTKRYLIHKELQTPKRQQPNLSTIVFGQRAEGATTLIPLVVDGEKVNVVKGVGDRFQTELGAENWKDLEPPKKNEATGEYVALKTDGAELFLEKWTPKQMALNGSYKAVIKVHEYFRLKDVHRDSFTIELVEAQAWRNSPVLNVFLAPNYVNGQRLKPVQAKPSPPPTPLVDGSAAAA